MQRTRHCRLGDLDEHQMKDKPTRFRAVLQATVEVGRPTLFPIIIIAAHLPVFTLQRHEGRIFSPMAWSVTSAVVGSLVLALALALVPLLCLLLLNKNLPHEDNRLVRACKRLCASALAWVIERPRTVLTGALLCLVAAGFLATMPGSEFLPELNEGSIGVNASLPPSGEFENQQSAMKRVSGVVPLSIFVIFLLLFDAFKSFRSALLILANIPFAPIGGIVALSRTGIPLAVSVSATIGFMALFGRAVLNGVVTVTHNNELGSEGVELVEPAHRRSLSRLRTGLMTALLGMLGLPPMALLHAIGAETQRPQAVVVMGGLISATVMTRLLLPTLCIWFARREGVMHEHV